MPGGGLKKSGFKSEVLAPTVGFTSGPADTPASPPAPAFDPGDRRGASSMLDGEEGLRKVPRGTRSRVHTLRSGFSAALPQQLCCTLLSAARV